MNKKVYNRQNCARCDQEGKHLLCGFPSCDKCFDSWIKIHDKLMEKYMKNKDNSFFEELIK